MMESESDIFLCTYSGPGDGVDRESWLRQKRKKKTEGRKTAKGLSERRKSRGEKTK